jgi:hypothetical protein
LRQIDEKEAVLNRAGYRYNFNRMIFVNRDAKKVFSVEHVEDSDMDRLSKEIREESDGREWKFYFNSDPSESVKEELVKVLH